MFVRTRKQATHGLAVASLTLSVAAWCLFCLSMLDKGKPKMIKRQEGLVGQLQQQQVHAPGKMS
jgi:hypothetical protein